MHSAGISEEILRRTTQAEPLLMPETPLHPLKVSTGQLWVPSAGMVWEAGQQETGALHRTETPTPGTCSSTKSVPRNGIKSHYNGKKGKSKV